MSELLCQCTAVPVSVNAKQRSVLPLGRQSGQCECQTEVSATIRMAEWCWSGDAWHDVSSRTVYWQTADHRHGRGRAAARRVFADEHLDFHSE